MLCARYFSLLLLHHHLLLLPSLCASLQERDIETLSYRTLTHRSFFRPFEYALARPPHVRDEVILKEDMAPYDGMDTLVSGTLSLCHILAAFHACTGPHCFAIPGNHDWFDGAVCFNQLFLARGWVGECI